MAQLTDASIDIERLKDYVSKLPRTPKEMKSRFRVLQNTRDPNSDTELLRIFKNTKAHPK